MNTLDRILEEIDKANSIVILTHENPDGDAIGTSLALYNALEKYRNKQVDLIVPEFPKCFNFLPNADKMIKDSNVESYDLAITVDVASIEMLNGWRKHFENADSTIVIDHHGTNNMFGDINFVNPNAPACSEVMIVLLNHFNMAIDKEIGTCLLTGIITDTAGFKYKGVTADTFRFVAGLMEKGVNVSETYRRVLQVRTKSAYELSRVANDRLQFLEDGKIAYTYVTEEECEKIKPVPGDHEGIVDIGRDIEGVEVSIFIRPLKKGINKVSLRSNEKVNVDEIALIYGGGGHPKAAGFSTTESIESIAEKLLGEVKHYL